MDSLDEDTQNRNTLVNMEVSDISTVTQDTNKNVEGPTVCQDIDTNSQPVPANEDDLIFVKPQVSSIRGKLKKPSDSPKANDNSDQKSRDIYNNPQPSSSSSNEKHLAKNLETYISNPSSQPEKQLLHTKENFLYSQPSTSKKQDDLLDNMCLKNCVDLYAPDTGPQMYHAKDNLMTRPIITKNLPQIFQYLPVYGKPGPNMSLKEFYRNKVREYVGCDLDDDDFSDLENYCSPEHLKTGRELKMETCVPIVGGWSSSLLHNNFSKPMMEDEPNLVILKKNKIRNEKDTKGVYSKKFKYRGVKILPFTQEENSKDSVQAGAEDEQLIPGVDVLYRVRVYRPYSYSVNRWRFTRTRHSIFSCDIMLCGRNKLTDLRDRFVCHNDFDMRVDVSDHPDMMPTAKAKELFPSGFLFINNVFYVDTREGCIDYSAPIREWAIKRKLGDFPKKDMGEVRLQDLVLKLGYPEVYVHQGNCEHVFLFSEVRLVGPSDPLRMSRYPCSTAIAQNQTVYCTTCAEFSAKWIVVGSDRVPFDPGFFCDTCFKLYMYKDGQKIGQFKAYRYRGNALNVLKP